jgi:peptide/nickel transport system substrate-binding protein
LTYIGFNFDAGLWDDARIRQAFIHAINRETIVRGLCNGAADVANSLFAAAAAPSDLNKYAYEPAHAKALLTAAGWEKINGAKPIPWLTCHDSAPAAKVMAAIQAMLAQVGVNLAPRVVDTATYRDIVAAPNPDPSVYPLLFDSAPNGPDPAIVDSWTAESRIPPNGANVARIRLPALNAALAAAMVETDEAKRATCWQEVARVANREAPVVPLWVAKRYGVVSANVKNFVWQPSPSGGPFDQRAELWSFG